MVNKSVWEKINAELDKKNVTLVAVSKTKSIEDIKALYDLGQIDFGENYVQELIEKQLHLPLDIRWHYIGHLQTNKVKNIAPFVHLIHAVDSFKLLLEINKQAAKFNRIIDILLQVHVAEEATKFGLDFNQILDLLNYYEAQKDQLKNIRICGLMGMASFTEDKEQITSEFQKIYNIFKTLQDTNFLFQDQFQICSMGMSGDYKIAVVEGSNMVRIGSLVFGERDKL